MNIARSVGVAVGILVGIIICVVFFSIANKNHKVATEYDERQKAVRGRGYMYGFYTIVAFECVMIVLGIGNITFPIEDYILHFAGILLGCMVMCGYCIWKDVYWGLNSNPRRYLVFFLLCAILNAVPVLGSLKAGTMYENGKLSFPFVNLLVLIMTAYIVLLLLVKKVVNSRDSEKED